MSFISYASNYEDVLLNRVFHAAEKGVYIDIGADHPVYSSTTKAFYDRGWSGVNVEPGPRFDLLAEMRPRDINVQAAITDFTGEVDFYINDDLQSTSSIFSTLHPSVVSRTKGSRKSRVAALTLAELVGRHVKDRNVDFLKIDAEGAEGAIIAGGDWVSCRPRIVVAESTEPFSVTRIDAEWVKTLGRNGYIEAYFDGINTWFVREETRDDIEYFKVPVNVLDDFTKFDPRLRKWQLAKDQQMRNGSRKSITGRLRRSLAKRVADLADFIAP